MVGPVGLSEIFWSVRFEVWHGTVVMTAQPAIVRAFQGKSRPGLLSVSLHMHTQDLFARAKRKLRGTKAGPVDSICRYRTCFWEGLVPID